jgi:hypothetical protein
VEGTCQVASEATKGVAFRDVHTLSSPALLICVGLNAILNHHRRKVRESREVRSMRYVGGPSADGGPLEMAAPFLGQFVSRDESNLPRVQYLT